MNERIVNDLEWIERKSGQSLEDLEKPFNEVAKEKDHYRITQKWGDGTKAWIYFEMEKGSYEEQITEKAIQLVKEDYKRCCEFPSFSSPDPCKKKITVKAWDNERNRVIKKDWSLKVIWR